MEKLKDNVSDSNALAKALCTNGLKHTNYKMYTSMEAALGFLNFGYLYLSNGANWNDAADSKRMSEKKVFAKCFSCSTSENIALWMLYGGERGKKGAMINFYPAIIREICAAEEIELGKFNDKTGLFDVLQRIKISDGNNQIFVSDMLYITDCKKGRTKISCGDDHEVVDATIIDHPDIFYKKYPWAYEKECRLVVRLDKKWQELAEHYNATHIRIIVSEKSLRRLRDGRLIRSPIYRGVDNGVPSLLNDEVNWNL